MADKKITELNLHTNLELSDVIPIINNGETKKTTYGSLYYGVRDSVISGSSQITIDNTSGFTEFSSSLSASIALGTHEQNLSNLATTGSNLFIGDETIIGALIVTGSIYMSGSNTLELTGSLRIEGSSSFEGSHVLSGSNTILGNTIMSGSVNVSGSTIQVGNNTLIGNTVLSGSISVSGSFTGSLQLDGDVNLSYPHNFYRWGNKLFNYGSFYSTITQSGSANVSQSMSYNSTDYSEGVSIVSGSRITLANIGVYNLQFSAQLVDTAGGDSTIYIWIKKNGQNVQNTATKVFLKANQETVAAWNWIIPATSQNDFYEIVWQTDDSDTRILAQPASGNYPAIPSIITTVTQIS